MYLCQDASGKRVALKVVSKTRIGIGWERELKGIVNYRKLTEDTPGLLKIYIVGEDDESFYYTMEVADSLSTRGKHSAAITPNHGTSVETEGQERADGSHGSVISYKPDTLAARLQEGPLAPYELVNTLTSLLQSIWTLHDAGFAHRDIKPENILFVNGEPKLADLGLLSPLSGTMTQMVGTLDFMPPEERLGEASDDSRESRQRNDLYAFGKLIYCCVTGNMANEFPSTPADMPLTLSNKYFFRLSLWLCDKEPTRRLRRINELLKEFEQTVRLCLYGESLLDKIRYHIFAQKRNFVSCVKRLGLFYKHHWFAAPLLSCALVAGIVWLSIYFAGRPDKETEELAQTIQTQKEIAKKTEMTQDDFTFYNGIYSVAVPAEWRVIDHDTIVQNSPQGYALAQRLHGILVPIETNGNANTIVSLIVLPNTADELSGLTAAQKVEQLKPYFADDVERLSVRQYRNERLNLDTILFVGIAHPSKAVVCYLYPQSDHTLVLCAQIPQELYDTDMAKFAAITDSLIYRIPQKNPQKK